MRRIMYDIIIVLDNFRLRPSTVFTGYVLTEGQTGEEISVFSETKTDTCGQGLIQTPLDYGWVNSF